VRAQWAGRVDALSGDPVFENVTRAEGVAVRLPEVISATPVSTGGWAAPATFVLLGLTVGSADRT
jgi:hypothetical protein